MNTQIHKGKANEKECKKKKKKPSGKNELQNVRFYSCFFFFQQASQSYLLLIQISK